MADERPKATDDTWTSRVEETASFRIDVEHKSLLPAAEMSTLRNQDPALSYLLNSPLRAVSQAGLDRLVRKLRPVEFAPGAKLLSQGTETPDLFFLIEGRVQIGLTNAGQRIELDTGQAGDIVGEMSFVTGTACTADVVASTPVAAYALSRKDFGELRSDYPELEIALANLASERLGSKHQDALTGKQFGGYQLTRCISRGGMGVVYAARDKEGCQVAVKMLRHKFIRESTVIDDFVQEGRLLSELQHPHIVSVRECFVAYNTRFLVMDYWDGADLSTRMRKRAEQGHTGGLDEATCLHLLGQVAAALRFAHSHGILHLDIKPANILASQSGKYALSDFGLSRLVERTESEPSIIGTLPYMPPEQFCLGGLTPAADYYALACTIGELLLGRRLFPQVTFREIRDAKQRPPDEVLPELNCNPTLARFLRMSLAIDPKDRPVDLTDFAG